MKELEAIFAENLTAARKKHAWTQAELAEKIHYSDKSVSKWERGEGLPDIKVMKTLADLFGVTVDYFLTEGAFHVREEYISEKNRALYQIWSVLLAVSIVWLAATAIFVYNMINETGILWIAFVWAIPASCILIYLFDRRYYAKRHIFIIASIFLWSTLAAIYLQWFSYHLWMLFILGAPAQIILFLIRQISHAK